MTPLARREHLFGRMFCDLEIEALWSSERFIEEFRAFEGALSEALSEVGLVEPQAADAAVRAIAGFRPDLEAMSAALPVDGVPVPEFVRQLKAFAGADALPALHLGATSQDLVDTALVRILRDGNGILEARLGAVIAVLEELDRDWGQSPMMGRTRMQAALPIRVADRLASWQEPLRDHVARLGEIRPRIERLQFGGAVGDRSALAPEASRVAGALARRLDLGKPARCWQTDRSGLAEYAGWLSLVSGTLGKIGQDICLMAQQGVDEIALEGGGTSSAMPHKQNPVLAETLVAFARFNAAQLAAMHSAVIHEQERSGAAWTLEWMVLPMMVGTTGKALLDAETLLQSIRRLGLKT